MGSVNTYNTQIWKNKIKQNLTKNESSLLNHLIKNARMLTLDKVMAKEIYSILISSLKNKATSQSYFGSYFEIRFRVTPLAGSKTYLLPQIKTINSYQHNFKYKTLHNILYLKRKLYIFGKIDPPLCSIYHSNHETVSRFFCDCVVVRKL